MATDRPGGVAEREAQTQGPGEVRTADRSGVETTAKPDAGGGQRPPGRGGRAGTPAPGTPERR